MAAATAVASAAEIPDSWVERNSQLFRACPPGVQRSTKTTIRRVAVESEANDGSKEARQQEEEENWAAAGCMSAMLINTESGVGYIDAPTGLQPPSFYRDLANHPNILATFVYTARRKAGFLPSAVGQELSQEEWTDYIAKFNAWMNELDAFWFYVPLIDHDVETVPTNSNASNAIVNALSKFVLKSAGDVEGGAEAEVTERIAKSFGLATEYMLDKHKNIPHDATNAAPQEIKAGYQHEAFGSPGPSNPSIPISFTATTLSTTEGSANLPPTTINRFTFRLNSANIIANAEALARGTTLIGTKVYCDYINGPLDEWADNRAPSTGTSVSH